jgi:hypothetical protein
MRQPKDSSTAGITLHNDHLRVCILPEEGGKIAPFAAVRATTASNRTWPCSTSARCMYL